MADNVYQNVGSEQEESRVINTIHNMFGDKIAFDIICAVVENCGGNLQSSVNAILSILQEDTAQLEPVKTAAAETKLLSSIVASSQCSSKDTYKTTNALDKGRSNMNMYKPQMKKTYKVSAGCEHELNTILVYHSLSYRTLIIMRGLPGSGKSCLSRHVVDITVGPHDKNYRVHIFSTDDFFAMKGFYNVQLLDEAHKWNQRRVEIALTQGLSPIIVDNTNTELWEMECYARAGVKEGYYIIVLEPKTPWSRNTKQLAKKNIHGVSEQKLSKMALRYQHIKKGTIMQEFGLRYPANKVPPVLRNIPLVTSVKPKMENQQNWLSCSNETVNPNYVTASGNCYLNSTMSVSGYLSALPGVVNQNYNTVHTNQSTNNDYSVTGIINQMSNINDFHAIKMSGENTNPFTTSAPPLMPNTSNQHVQSNVFDLPPSVSVNDTNPAKHLSEDVFNSQIDESSKNLPIEVPNSTVCNDTQNIGIKSECTPIDVTAMDQNQTVQASEGDEVTQSADNQQEQISEDEIRLAHIADAEKKIEELKKLEDEWEMGGDWVEVDNRGNATEVTESQSEPKPQRKRDASLSSNNEPLMPIIENTQNWQDIVKFMPSWDHDSKEIVAKKEEDEVSVEMTSRETSIELDDWDICNSKNIVISAFDRDINLYFMPQDEIKNLKKIKLDKSTQVKEDMLYNAYRCKNEEKHFKGICKIFKNIPKSNLREMFEKCHNDAHWTIDLLLEAGNQPILNIRDSSDSGTESENDYDCDCFKFASEIENKETDPTSQIENIGESSTNIVSSPSQLNKQRKGKTPLSKSAIQLKKELEQNIVISDDHYSEHCLKIRNMRHGDLLNMPGTSKGHCASIQDNSNLPPEYLESLDSSNDADDECSNTEEIETMNVNVGKDFIVNLDQLFNRKILYSENIMPIVNMPVSLLNQINALWLESYANQLDSQAAYSDILVNEDQELARQLAEKEAELAREGKEPEVPDFKEIMDMDVAIALYQKDVAEWKNNKPNDLAAKMTRDKLFNLFPELPSETLIEVLMAHENNFQATVETLLMSTGQASVLQEENGLNKFIMNKEMAQRKILEEQRRQALEEEEFPLLTKIDPEVAMSKAEQNRAEAMVHLDKRKITYDKAQDFVRRGMTEVASYYTSIASYHKNQFERFNNYAASYFIHSHAANRNKTTMDLHFLFVREAMQALDLFLDHHIMILRKHVTNFNKRRPGMIFLITGRGVHSPNGPKIKPAAKRRLRQRGVSCSDLYCLQLTRLKQEVEKKWPELELNWLIERV
ncbi:NEDD4-binding protein 2-like 1 [Eumeta japonica]|uniref:NEDD4-binding protein 2-like 1 n=1 Tax=Eumeta variegata TaxID=151549 RepID=A0A4C1Z6F2_EUMVA|nr:NEDD4-binding protein 2-like 1 [Eumeta japonica]